MINSGSFPKALEGKKAGPSESIERKREGAVDKMAIKKRKQLLKDRKHPNRQLSDAPRYKKDRGLIF